MIRKKSGSEPETDGQQHFAELLSWHLDRGTRPDGSPELEGVPWTVKEFAAAVGVTVRTVSAWRRGEYPPKDLRAIVQALFGKDKSKYQAERDDLHRLHRYFRRGTLSVDRSSDAVETESRKGADSARAVTENFSQLMEREFPESVGLLTVSAGQIMLVPRPGLALIGFRDLITRLWEIDRTDHGQRILIWTLDLGKQDFNDEDSRLRFVNVLSLVARFKALKRFKEMENITAERWKWLQSRVVIVLHDARGVRPDAPRFSDFDPTHVLFSEIPPRLAESPEFLALYENQMLNTNYCIFLRKSVEHSSETRKSSNELRSHADQHFTFRYFGNALLQSDGTGEREIRGLELKTPGRSYVQALGAVYAAATQLLGLKAASGKLSIDGVTIDVAQAQEELRHHGFLLLRLDEFLNL